MLSSELTAKPKHRVLLLLMEGSLLLLNLLDQRLLVHQLRKCLLLVNKLESHTRIFFTRMDHLKDLIDGHLKAEGAEDATDRELLVGEVGDLTGE